MHKHLLSILLTVNLAGWCFGDYTIQPLELEILDGSFRLSLPNDPGIKWVAFNVNINKEFKSFEAGQLTSVASIPINRKWSVEFERTLNDNDFIYAWVAVQHERLIFRDKKDPMSVLAVKSGNPNYRVTTPTVTDVTEEPKECRPALSEVPKTFGGPYCRGDLMFLDNFDVFNEQIWTNEIRVPSTLDDAEFVLYNGTLGVENGVLKIEASSNTKNVQKDLLDLGIRCTSINVETECYLKPSGVLILPPIISGRASTKNNFHFKYGRIVVRAKVPKGDWLFPLISLQPAAPTYGGNYKSGEIRVAHIHGNPKLSWGAENINGGRLFGGAIVDKNPSYRHQFMKDITLPNVQHFGDEFHLYELTWTPKELIMAVDGKEYGRIKTNFKQSINEPIWNKGGENAPLDQMSYITLGLAAGGNGDFPETDGKPWRNTDPRGSLNFHRRSSNWMASWSQPSLEVDYVKVYAV